MLQVCITDSFIRTYTKLYASICELADGILKLLIAYVGIYFVCDIRWSVTDKPLDGQVIHSAFTHSGGERVPAIMRTMSMEVMQCFIQGGMGILIEISIMLNIIRNKWQYAIMEGYSTH